MVRLEVTLTEGKNKRNVPLKNEPSRVTVQSDEETEDEYFEMSGEELSSRYSVNMFFISLTGNATYNSSEL